MGINTKSGFVDKATNVRSMSRACVMIIVTCLGIIDPAASFVSPAVAPRYVVITLPTRSQPVFYRNRHHHEEQYAVASATVPVPDMSSGSSTSPLSGINKDLVRGMLLSQGVTLGIALIAAALLGDDAIIRSIPTSLQIPLDIPSLLLAGLTAAPLIATSTYFASISGRRGAALMHSSTLHTVATLFGRRLSDGKFAGQPVRENVLSNNLSTTQQVLEMSMVMSLVSAVCEHYVFRHLLLLQLSLVMPLPAAILLQGLVSGIAHGTLAENGTRPEETRLIVLTQTMYGIILGTCYVVTSFQGALVPILAHALYMLHDWNASWHSCNDQLDWVEENCSTSRLKNDPLSSSPPYYLQRFFYAFDAERQHSLSLHDAHRAVAYAFPDDLPSYESVETMYNDLVDDSKISDTTADGRIRLPEFEQLLKTLKSRQHVEQGRLAR